VLIHVGFALSKIDEAEAKATPDFLTGLGRRLHRRGRCSGRLQDRLTGRGDSSTSTPRRPERWRRGSPSCTSPGRSYKFMEICVGHTHTIYKHGLEDYLPETITLVHGPGCPVCVIPMGRVVVRILSPLVEK